MESGKPENHEEIDRKIAYLVDNKEKWLSVSFQERIRILEQLRRNVLKYKEEWLALVRLHRKIEASDDAEELSGGIFSTLRLLRLLIEVFKPAAQDEKSGKPIHFASPPKVRQEDGQHKVSVLPWGFQESQMYPDISAEVWVEPGYEFSQGKYLLESFKKKDPVKIALVLGAGNQASIGLLDAIYKLFNENQVLLYKHNPVNDYFAPIFDRVMEPLIRRHFVHHVTGGVSAGAYLINKPEIDTIHMTGSDKTYNMIVWGTPNAPPKDSNPTPKITKHFTSELGCVTPWIIVPGPWNDIDIDYQVQNLVGGIINNVSFNCVAPKVIIVEKSWQGREAFMTRLKEVLETVPSRYNYYPGAEQRYKKFMEEYPQAIKTAEQKEDLYLPWTIIRDAPAKVGEYCLCNEAFCPIVAEVAIDGNDDIPEFLKKAVSFANDNIWGNLSCTIVIHQDEEKAYKKEFEESIKNLKYGTVCVNAWSGIGYGLGCTIWGAYPGNDSFDIQSGTGFVHNAFLIDHPQKNVIRVPFRLLLDSKLPSNVNHNNKIGALHAMSIWEYHPTPLNMVRVLYNSIMG